MAEFKLKTIVYYTRGVYRFDLNIIRGLSVLDSCFSSLSTVHMRPVGVFIMLFFILSQSLLITKSCLPRSCVYRVFQIRDSGAWQKPFKKSYLHLHLRDLVPKICKLYLYWQKGLFIFILFIPAFNLGCSISKEQVSLSPTPRWLAIFQIITYTGNLFLCESFIQKQTTRLLLYFKVILSTYYSFYYMTLSWFKFSLSKHTAHAYHIVFKQTDYTKILCML